MSDYLHSAMAKTTDDLIDDFVGTLRGYGLRIAREENQHRLEEFEALLPKRLPLSFRSLLARYSFPAFDCGGITFFNWTADASEYAAEAAAAKGSLAELLLRAGFVQIGRPDTGAFDAVCFDLNQRRQNREWRLVLVDHEEALCNDRVKVIRELWPSFRRLAESRVRLPLLGG